MARGLGRFIDPALAAIGTILVGLALASLRLASDGLEIRALSIEGTPATVFRGEGGAPGPAVVVAHGFAGSQQLMQAFATTLARNGYVAITFDFRGHGRNPRPLTGSIVDETGATRVLVEETLAALEAARAEGDGRLALLGHSMASDIVVRAAQAAPDVDAVVAVSMFSPAVTPRSPRNLLVLVGGLEAGLTDEALRAVALAGGGEPAREGVTVGDPAAGTGRRAVFVDGAEHVGVLYARESMAETLAWLDATFGVERGPDPPLDRRGPWILALLLGAILLARPAARLLPRVADRPVGAGLPWRRLWIALLVPALATPLLLRVLPTEFLPTIVGDYLALHFGVYGLLAFAAAALARRGARDPGPAAVSGPRLAAAALAAVAFGFVAIVWPIDSYVTSFVPTPARAPLVAAMAAGTLAFFLADEWATRGVGAARGGYLASKLAFVASLALAVALDFERLFFLVIITPVVAAFLVVYGLLASFAYRATLHPAVPGLANAVAFAWALGVTFPLVAR